MVDTPLLARSTAAVVPELCEVLPRSLGGYELLERVGRGATAQVWLARRAVGSGGLKPCALKIIHGHIAQHDRHRRMFAQEGRLALKMSHANIVSVFDMGEDQGRLYLALEWIDGVSLRAFTERVLEREGPLEVAEACYIVGEILHGLRHAHELTSEGRPLGVVHRDVAPHNVIVSAAGEVKLADFGIARVDGEASSGEHLKGRARYMAPEHLRGEPCQASDLFSVGAILHELLEGRRFREGFEQQSDWHSTFRQPPPPLRRRGVPPEVEALRVGLLQPALADRIPCAAEALSWLVRCPPCTTGKVSLRTRYERSIDLPRRTGLTARHSASPSVPRSARRSRSRAAPRWQPSSSGHRRGSVTSRRPSGPRDREQVLRDREQTATLRRARSGAVIRRRRAPALPPRRRPDAVRWVGRGLWVLAVLLGLVAVGLSMAPTARPAPACTEWR